MTELSAQDLTRSVSCKEYGCSRDALATVGPYAYLCDEHKEIQRKKLSAVHSEAQGNRPNFTERVRERQQAVASTSNGGGFTERVKQLTAAARVLDRKKAAYAKAKDELEDALDDYRDALAALQPKDVGE